MLTPHLHSKAESKDDWAAYGKLLVGETPTIESAIHWEIISRRWNERSEPFRINHQASICLRLSINQREHTSASIFGTYMELELFRLVLLANNLSHCSPTDLLIRVSGHCAEAFRPADSLAQGFSSIWMEPERVY
jgi:hypothetical protein